MLCCWLFSLALSLSLSKVALAAIERERNLFEDRGGGEV